MNSMKTAFRVIREDGTDCGTLEINRGNVTFGGASDPGLASFLQANLARGIPMLEDGVDQKKGTSAIVARPAVPAEAPFFPSAVKQFLERNGYRVVEAHPEVAEEIKRILQAFPDDVAKRDILERLPRMSHLEQTFLLRELQSFLKREAEKHTDYSTKNHSNHT